MHEIPRRLWQRDEPEELDDGWDGGGAEHEAPTLFNLELNKNEVKVTREWIASQLPC